MEDIADRSDNELWTLLGEADGLDRVAILGELGARVDHYGDWAQAASLFATAGDTSRALDDHVTAGYAYRRQGSSLFATKRFDEAASAYRASIDDYRAAGRTCEVVVSTLRLCDALRAAGDWAESLHQAAAAVSLAEAEGDDELVGQLCLQQARALYVLEREEESLDVCAKGRAHFRAAQVPLGVAAIDDMALSGCLSLGRLDEALELATNCFVIAQATERPSDDANAELRLAETHLARGECDDAIEYAEQARDRFSEAEDMIGFAHCEVLRAQALQDCGRDQEAIQGYVTARVLFDANGLDDDVVRCDVLRARCLHWMERFGDAAKVNASLLAAALADGRVLEAGWAVARLADNLVRNDELTAAAETVDDWLRAADRDDPDVAHSMPEVLAAKAIALSGLGEPESAYALAEEAIAMSAGRDVSFNTASLFEIRARHLMTLGDDRGRQELAHAIAVYLAVGAIERARDLSRDLLPKIRDKAKKPGLAA